ncbi:MAG: PEP-CTERM sorting domain-containing protein [Pseudomonadota bacterium]
MTKPAAPHPPRPPRRPAAWRAPLRSASVLSLLALCVASPLAVVSLLGVSAVAGQPHAFGVPPGVSDDGRLLPATATQVAAAATGQAGAAPHGLQLRQGCRWGQPGRAPYQGSTRQALVAAGLPEEVVAEIEAQRNQGRKSGRLAISRDGIRHTGDGRVFPARGFALTFGMTLCQDASVNFPKGHVEMADLYEARDAQGRPHAVMVPDVCGNVSVLGAQGGQGRVAGMASTLARRAAGLMALADVLDPPAAGQPAAAVVGGDGGTPGGAGAQGDAGGVAAAQAARARPSGLAGESGGLDAPGAGPVDTDADTGAGTGPGTPSAAAGPAGTATAPSARPDRGSAAAPAAPGRAASGLLPPQAAGEVVRELGRVTAAAGRGLESLAGTPGAAAPVAAGQDAAQPVPEPGSLWTALLALAVLGALRRRRH